MDHQNLSSLKESETSVREYYTSDQIALLDMERIPKHVAVIMDGNRRWAMKNDRLMCEGHHHGAKNLIDIAKSSKELGVKVLTVYGLSTENLVNRGQAELDTLFQIFVEFLTRETPTLIENDIRLHTIGDLGKLSDHLNQAIEKSKSETSNCTSMDFVVALNYGARDELTRAVGAVLDDFQEGLITKEKLTEAYLSSKLDTCQWPDPDLLIRTSGEQRMSNFLLWQISYAEFFSTKVLWPDFSAQCFFETILEFQKRERRLGD
jgi:undecaprenyl diphosphate synthase